MFSTLNTAVSALEQFQQDMSVIGNNMANVNTTGYKDASMNFEDTLSQAIGLGGGNLQVGSGVSTSAIASNFNQGTIASTGVGSDLAVNGQGFFTVKNPTGGAQYVTRDGSFQVDASGYLITSGGLRVQGYNTSALSATGDIKIDATGAPATAAPGATVQSFSINQNGDVNVVLSDGTTFVRGQVLLQSFNDPNALVKQGGDVYAITAAAGAVGTPAAPQTAGLGSVVAGSLEMSNVDLTSEMTNLITAERAFESNAKVVTTSDEVMQTTVNLIR